MNYFTLDTNILIGVANETDELHEKSLSLITGEDRKGHKCFLVYTAVREFNLTFRKKLNQAIGEILEELRKIEDVEQGFDLKRNLVELFNRKINQKTLLTNFYKLLFKKIDEYIIENLDISRLFTYLVELTENLSRIAFDVINDIIGELEIHYIDLTNEDHIEKVSKINELSREIIFKDKTDKAILIEVIITVLDLLEKTTLYSSDKELKIKALAVIKSLKGSFQKIELLDIKHIDEYNIN
ncbi:MAG: hypothetical protein QW327_05620 [Candidatus Odinarchaeota archaeon]